MKNISLLGSTGSIGVNTLDIVRRSGGTIDVMGLAAGRNIAVLSEQINEFRPRIVAVIDENHARSLDTMCGATHRPSIVWGEDGYCEVASLAGTDMVVSAIVGAAGLIPTVAAIDAGKDIALANKETMVIGGELVVKRARERDVTIIPVDSEHSAIFQCLRGHGKEYVKRIILTASGGPFVHYTTEDLTHVRPADALKHPNWNMGKKITVDSASMMNKGLEVIEAQWLFGIDTDKIDIVIHPQSIVHSMVEYIDGSVIAQLGAPDMRGPISYALSFPARFLAPNEALDMTAARKLDFLAPDCETFRSLSLAYRAARTGGSMPAVMNAANEIAVESFLGDHVAFLDIFSVIEQTMDRHEPEVCPSVDAVLKADRWGRETAREIIAKEFAENR